MSVADRLNKLSTDITNAYTSIENKGGIIPSDKNTDNLHTAIDSIQSSNIIGATAEGESLSLTNTKAMPYKDYVVEGKSEQDGEPSPSNPSDIHSVADDVNLFDGSKIANSSISVTDNGKTIIMPIASSGNGYVNVNAFLKDLCPKLNVGDVVYLNFTRNINPNTNNFIYLHNSSASPSSVEWSNGTSKTITQDLLDSYMILYGNRAQDGETQQIIITDFKIQKNKITPYSPYNQGTVTIKQRGKNLIDLNRTLGTPSNTQMENTTKRTFYYNKYVVGITSNNYYDTSRITSYNVNNNNVQITVSLSGYGIGFPVELKANTSYTLSYDINVEANTTSGISFYQSDGTHISYVNSNLTNKYLNFTTPSNCAFAVIIFRPPVNTTSTYSNIQLEEGSTATSYEPYQGYDKVFQTEPLRSLPNGVRDSLEADGIHRNTNEAILDGSDDEDWKIWSASLTNVERFYINIDGADIVNSLCDKFKYLPGNEDEEHYRDSTSGGMNKQFVIFINKSRLSEVSINGLKQYLQDNPIKLLYKLAEETIEPLTQNQATTMLDIIKTGSYEGTTNIYTDEDVKPTIEVEYYKYGETGGLPTVENEKLIFDKELQIDREELIF